MSDFAGSGALTFRRYVVEFDDQDSLQRLTATEVAHNQVSMALRRYGFRPPDADRGEVESFGWINPQRPLVSDFEFDDLRVDSLLFLAVRRDKKSVPAWLKKAKVAERIEKVKREKNLERLTKQHRQAIEEEVLIEMLWMTPPASSMVQLVWDLNSGDLFVGTTSGSMCERICDLFRSTFDVRLKATFPGLVAFRHLAESVHESVKGIIGLSPSLVMDRFGGVGIDFLTWLVVDSADVMEHYAVSLDGNVLLRDGSGLEESVRLSSEDMFDMAEFSSALRSGKRMIKAKVRIGDSAGNDWVASVDGVTLDLSGVTVPVPKLADAEESWLLRVQAIQELARVLSDFLFLFFSVRFDSEKWKAVVDGWNHQAGTEVSQVDVFRKLAGRRDELEGMLEKKMAESGHEGVKVEMDFQPAGVRDE